MPDSTGELYCVAYNHGGAWVLRFASDSASPDQLRYDGLDSPEVVAVDTSDSVYIAGIPGRVVKIPSGSSQPTALPLIGLEKGTVMTGLGSRQRRHCVRGRD